MTPTARTLERLRAEGWHCEVVEQNVRIPGRTFKRDLWGFTDILCLRGAERLAVQVTSASNVSARVKKITDSPLLPMVREAGIGVVVHGWSRKADGKWHLREVDLS